MISSLKNTFFLTQISLVSAIIWCPRNFLPFLSVTIQLDLSLGKRYNKFVFLEGGKGQRRIREWEKQKESFDNSAFKEFLRIVRIKPVH